MWCWEYARETQERRIETLFLWFSCVSSKQLAEPERSNDWRRRLQSRSPSTAVHIPPPPFHMYPLCGASRNPFWDGGDQAFDQEASTSIALRPTSILQMDNLPEEIQTLVISLLPLKEAVSTSILSKNWRILWMSYPNLCFDGTEEVDADQDSVRLKKYDFMETVDLIMQHHRGTGLNKFGIRFRMWPQDFDYFDRWIGFAIASKAKVMDIDLIDSTDLYENAYQFPLDTLDAQGGSFIQSMRLSDVCIMPHPNIRGFTKLTMLVLRFVEIFGDLSDLLLKCPFLNNFDIDNCFGLTNLSITHQLNKLQSLRIAGEEVETVECHGADLANFEYTGPLIPIVLHGCSKLEKASISFSEGGNTLVYAFTEFPGILAVKILTVSASLWRYNDQVTTRPLGMFKHLRHLTCKIFIFYDDSNTNHGIIKLAHCLDFAPQLKTLHLDMVYTKLLNHCWNIGEAAGEGGCHMRRHDHLKTVYMSGFRCYRAQVALACCILENTAVLDHMAIEPKVISSSSQRNSSIPVHKIQEWAHHTSVRFGKGITVLADAPSQLWSGSVNWREDLWNCRCLSALFTHLGMQ